MANVATLQAEPNTSNQTAFESPTASLPEIRIDGQVYRLEFTWKKFAEARVKLGEDPDMMNPDVLSQYVVLALNKHHPMVTADQIMTASPPLVPVARAVRSAISRLFWGDEAPQSPAT